MSHLGIWADDADMEEDDDTSRFYSRMAEAAKRVRKFTGARGTEDLEDAVYRFLLDYDKTFFGVQRKVYEDPFVDKVKSELHKCAIFMELCSGKAGIVAHGVFKALAAEMQTLMDNRAKGDTAPKGIFDRFIRSMKDSLGPSDKLLYWLFVGAQIQLQEISAAGF